jgi:hypothetical protein
MDWTYPRPRDAEGGPEGLSSVLRRLQDELGEPALEGTRFLFDRREMMAATREIELVAEGSLLVGFQRADKFEHEQEVYEAIAARGVDVTAFGAGRPTDPGLVRWIQLPFDVKLLENQWFLIIAEPEPLAFVSYELSEADRFGMGGVSDQARSFAGFVTHDRRVIEALRRHLREIEEGGLATVEPASEVLSVARGARTILVATDDSPEGWSAGTRRWGIALARAIEADLILYDRSAESYLVDPYPYPEVLDGQSTLDRRDVVSLGRPHLAQQIDEAESAGVRARAWLPRRPGPKGMADLVAKTAVDVVLLPESVTRPSLLERIRGEMLSRWKEALSTTILVSGADGELRLAVRGTRAAVVA